LPGTVYYSPVAGTAAAPAYLEAYLYTTFTTKGTDPVTAAYSGDANYGASTSSVGNIVVQYPQPTLTLSPNSQTVPAGTSLTLTAFVDTTSKGATPTGTVTFYNSLNSAAIQSVSVTGTTDANGNAAAQALLSFIPSTSETVYALYNGDANYLSVQSTSPVSFTVTGSDFGIFSSPTTVTLEPPEGGGVNISIVGQSAYAGTVTFSASSCSGLPAESSCSFSPASVTGSGVTSLSVVTTGPQSAKPAAHSRASSVSFLADTLGAGFIGMLTLGSLTHRRRWKALCVLYLLALMLALANCGGGGAGGGGNNTASSGTPPGTYNVTVTATSGSLTHTTSFQLNIE
jgi:hypothetical protein